MSDSLNETTRLMDYVCPKSQYLESWGDAKPYSSVYSIQQQTINPIFNSRQVEQNLLKCFAKMPNKALSRDDLNKMLGGKMEDRSIDVAITRIRKKIEKDQRFPTYLQTIRGFGWKLNTFNSKELDNET